MPNHVYTPITHNVVCRKKWNEFKFNFYEEMVKAAWPLVVSDNNLSLIEKDALILGIKPSFNQIKLDYVNNFVACENLFLLH